MYVYLCVSEEVDIPKKRSVVVSTMSSSSHHEEGAASMWDFQASSIYTWAPMLSNFLSIHNTSSSYHHDHHHHLNPNSNSVNSCEEEDVSMASSALTVESSYRGILETTCSNELLPEHIPVDNHLWSHMLL